MTKPDGVLPFFRHPSQLDYASDRTIFLCGHFDGLDVYRVLNEDEFVLVRANEKTAVFTVSGSLVSHWLSRNPEMLEPCAMRAVAKAMVSLSEQFNELVGKLRGITRDHQDDSSFGVLVCDTCDEAADWLDAMRECIGL